MSLRETVHLLLHYVQYIYVTAVISNNFSEDEDVKVYNHNE